MGKQFRGKKAHSERSVDPLTIGKPAKGEISVTSVGAVLPGPYFLLANYLVLSLTPDWTQGRAQNACAYGFQPRWIPEQRPIGRLAGLIKAWCPSLSDLGGVFLHVCSWGLPDPKDWKYVTP